MEQDVYSGWSQETLRRLYEEYDNAPGPESEEKYKAYYEYQKIPLINIARKHGLDQDQVMAFAEWLGSGIGNPQDRKDLPQMLKDSKVLNPDIVRQFKENRDLIADLIEYPEKVFLHKPRSKVGKIMSLPLDSKIAFAQTLIDQVLAKL